LLLGLSCWQLQTQRRGGERKLYKQRDISRGRFLLGLSCWQLQTQRRGGERKLYKQRDIGRGRFLLGLMLLATSNPAKKRREKFITNAKSAVIFCWVW